MTHDQPRWGTFAWAYDSPPQFQDARRALAYARVYTPEMLGKLVVALERECPEADAIIERVLEHYHRTGAPGGQP